MESKPVQIKPEAFALHAKGEIRGRSPDGKVIYIFENGDKYIGAIKNDKPNGRGTYSFLNGDMFESTFVTDEDDRLTVSGDIIYRWQNGNVYRGSIELIDEDSGFHGFVLSGRGLFTYANGDTCEGEFRNGMLEGDGTYRFSDGSVYTGSFKGGKMNGAGTMAYPDGSKHKGNFIDDEIVD